MNRALRRYILDKESEIEKVANLRAYNYQPKTYYFRTNADIDYSRILYSSSYRRLQGKMQLFVPKSEVFYRNRLTHSHEVAQIAKTIAKKLKLKDSITVQTCSLAHDIGNPPFGHAGEKFLSTCSNASYEGNAQTLRILRRVEERHYDFNGLNLTIRTLLGVVKYFKKFDKSERDKVEYFVSDMWRTFSDISSVWFKNATKIVDKYHWIRQIMCAFESVRKEEQKKFSESHRRYFKNSRKLLLKRFDDLNDEQKQQVNIMLYTSPNLCTAHFYKEDFLKILDCQDRQSARKAMSDWINSAYDCGIPRFVKCAKTMQNWLTGILDSFTTPLTNGFIEGCNNKIKVLKRNAYGYRDFNRFRNRILHMVSLKSAKNNTKQAAV